MNRQGAKVAKAISWAAPARLAGAAASPASSGWLRGTLDLLGNGSTSPERSSLHTVLREVESPDGLNAYQHLKRSEMRYAARNSPPG